MVARMISSVAAEFLEGRLPVAADLVVVLVLLDTKGRG